MARAIDDQQLDIQLVVVAGKNKSLKHKLESVAWDQATWIYAKVHAGDALVPLSAAI
ncbi:MAG UNVERIFIED_CONTAM: hypothetical protein LVT10_23430 [Anaerolineae bacterium]|jgi:hypothetical protein